MACWQLYFPHPLTPRAFMRSAMVLFALYFRHFRTRSMHILIIYLVLFASARISHCVPSQCSIYAHMMKMLLPSGSVFISLFLFGSFHSENVCLLVGHDFVCHIGAMIPPGKPSIKFRHLKFHYRFIFLLNQMEIRFDCVAQRIAAKNCRTSWPDSWLAWPKINKSNEIISTSV